MALLPPLSTTSLKFPEIGTTHTGTLIEIGDPQQETEYSPDGQGPPAFWDKERTRPRMQIRLLLQCEPDPAVAGDDGRRALYATVSAKPGGMYAVVNKALESANALGGQLTVQFTGTDPESKNPQNPRKMYAASYVEPSLAQQMQSATDTTPAAPAPAPAPAPVAAPDPVATAPAPTAAPAAEEVIPPPFTTEQWASFTDAQKNAVRAQQQ